MQEERALFTFRGEFDPASFRAFASHRAQRLALALELRSCDSAGASLSVTGPPALLDAFEMACSLGPYDCLVRDIERHADG